MSQKIKILLHLPLNQKIKTFLRNRLILGPHFSPDSLLIGEKRTKHRNYKQKFSNFGLVLSPLSP